LLTPANFIDDLVSAMEVDPTAQVATPAIRLRSADVRALQAEEAAGRVGGTTVVTDSAGRALYFSKRLIPHVPDRALDDEHSPIRLHVGVYAYRPEALRDYVSTPPSQLEELEGLEQLRFLDFGVPVKVVEVAAPP
jgi:3-deoxy-manno-octulosonate cytidylyltransferase (CMP-KDO synthetase)